MNSLINISLKRRIILQPINGIALAYVVIGAVALQNYLVLGSANFILGLMALPFTSGVNSSDKSRTRYGWLTLALLLLCFIMPVKTLLYFSIGFSFLFFIETFYGATNILAFFVLLFSSPVFQSIGEVFSFPMRLQLTKVAGSLFNWVGAAVQTKGNIIFRSGHEFSVDPACMGLTMITASLLSGVMVMGFFGQKYNRRPKSGMILVYFTVILLLNVVANLFRILLLVQFNIPPATFAHDIAGLSCLMLYVLIPATACSKAIVRRAPVITGPTINPKYNNACARILLHAALPIIISLLAFRVLHSDTFTLFAIPDHVDGYTVSKPAPGIVKLDRPGSLLYVKYLRGFYDTEHNPMLCWTGSGYSFSGVSVENIYDRDVFTGIISNGRDKFYSAWWYDNGIKTTTSQLAWRWDLLQGARHYVLVNISCTGEDELKKEIKMIIDRRTLAPFFK